jgi:hypothetical protein
MTDHDDDVLPNDDDVLLLMEHHAIGTDKWNVFSEMDELKLTMMREMLLGFRDGPLREALLSYWIGVTTTMLVERHGFCAPCGANHMAALEN